VYVYVLTFFMCVSVFFACFFITGIPMDFA